MGKAQKKKAASRHRHNPIRVPDSHLAPGLAAASASAASAKRDAILPIMQKLESSEAADRAWACAAVSNLINNDPSTRRLLQGKNVVGVLITRLSDAVDEVVVEAAGALRNLAIDGGFEICGEMYNKHILDPLKGLIPKISSAFSTYLESSTTPTGAQAEALSFVFQLAENVVTLFWCLSEISTKALNAINNIGLIPFLIALIENRSKFPAKLVVAAAQCMFVLTDDNAPAVTALHGNPAALSKLLSIAQSSNTDITFVSGGSVEHINSLRVLACGILKNVSPLPKSSSIAEVDLNRTVILPLFVPLLGVDITSAANTAYTIASKPTDPIPPELRHTPKSDHRTADDKELERIETQLLTVQLCLEILTGICASLPDMDLELDIDKDGKNRQTTDDDDLDGDADPTNSTPTSLLHLLTLPLLALSRPTPTLSFPPPALPSVHPPTTSVLGAIHVRALECLNNLFVGVRERVLVTEGDDEEMGGRKKEERSAPGFTNLFGAGQERRAEMWAVAVGVLWGLARMARGTLVPNEEQIKILVALCDAAQDDKIRVQCIGTLGCLAQYQSEAPKGSYEANLTITKYLLHILMSGTGASPPLTAGPTPNTTSAVFGTEPILQAASSLVDIFADENSAYDANFRVAKVLKGMSDSIRGARKLVKSIGGSTKGANARGSGAEGAKALKGWADGVVGDLAGFVEYRRNVGR
ncbi:hypothetical protein DL93DRAFT_2049554 [Clavulina sp. PMI_390]|nr:hypothetical protein DL93DRAFT_2049554 [Clavulina sp. PMI_390]